MTYEQKFDEKPKHALVINPKYGGQKANCATCGFWYSSTTADVGDYKKHIEELHQQFADGWEEAGRLSTGFTKNLTKIY